MLKKEEIRDWLLGLQERICVQLEETDGKGKFISDPWQRSGGGGGITRVIAEGKIIEKGWGEFLGRMGKNSRACHEVDEVGFG
jgi:coproporphyrinogen III oxidase